MIHTDLLTCCCVEREHGGSQIPRWKQQLIKRKHEYSMCSHVPRSFEASVVHDLKELMLHNPKTQCLRGGSDVNFCHFGGAVTTRKMAERVGARLTQHNRRCLTSSHTFSVVAATAVSLWIKTLISSIAPASLFTLPSGISLWFLCAPVSIGVGFMFRLWCRPLVDVAFNPPCTRASTACKARVCLSQMHG